MRYRVTVNTEKYVCGRCSKKNWEAGTRNDYMLAINGRTFCENNLREVGWLLELFHGITHNHDEWTPENSEKVGKYGGYYGMSDRFYKWLHKKAHKVKYHDRLCGFLGTASCRAISTSGNILLNSRRTAWSKYRSKLCMICGSTTRR